MHSFIDMSRKCTKKEAKTPAHKEFYVGNGTIFICDDAITYTTPYETGPEIPYPKGHSRDTS